MIIHVDSNSAVPVFAQLRSQIERLIASDQLRPGMKLPPIRQLATDLGVARGTINKVYDELVRDGLVRTEGRHGTVVLPKSAAVVSTDDLAAAADTLAVVVRQLGLPPSKAHDALDKALERLSPGSEPINAG